MINRTVTRATCALFLVACGPETPPPVVPPAQPVRAAGWDDTAKRWP